jgi:hypothetical protein
VTQPKVPLNIILPVVLAERWSLSWCDSATVCSGAMSSFAALPLPAVAPTIAVRI